jgi:hypothetical protein
LRLFATTLVCWLLASADAAQGCTGSLFRVPVQYADLVASDYWNNGVVVEGVAYATATHGGPTRTVDYDRDGNMDVVSFSFGSANPVRATDTVRK